jgi:hypothetical protein
MYRHFMALRRAARIRGLRQVAAGVVAAVLFGGLGAQAGDMPVKGKDTTQNGTADLTWGGLGFGVGIAADFDLRGTRVGDAEVVNNIVRVKDSTTNVNVGLVLEAHYFLLDFIGKEFMKSAVCSTVYCANEIGFGPFVAIEAGNASTKGTVSGPITSYALGLMVGLHHPKFTTVNGVPVADRSSWNFGIGLRIDPNTQVLGDGIVANQPLPAGETAVRFKKEPRSGIMLLSSFSF